MGNSKAKIGLTGSALIALSLGGRTVIPEISNPVTSFAGSLLAPWPNRIAGGTYAADGATLELPINDGRGNALHGLVFDAAGSAERITDSKVNIAHLIAPSSGYPWEVEVTSTFELFENEIRVSYTAKNLSETVAPIGLGAHPYFPIEFETQVEILAAKFSIHAENMIPVEERATKELGLGPDARRLASELNLDTQFSDFYQNNGGVVCRLFQGKNVTEIYQDPLGWLMVYTADDYPWLNGSGPAIAIEPQTCAVDAFNNGKGLVRVKPGESISLTWGVRTSLI